MSKLLPRAGAAFIRVLHATLRVRHVRAHHIDELNAAGKKYIIAFWHSHLLLMLHSRYQRPITVLISQSKDGEIIARVFDHYDVTSARGSATRGGMAAMREMIRVARSGQNIVFTPDGPKGPARVAKDGVVYAAQATGLPIVPIAFAAKKKSYCAPGIAWSCRIPFRRRFSSMVSRSRCRATATSKSGGCA